MSSREIVLGSSVVDERIDEFVASARAPSTRRAYAEDWAQFERWCAHFGLDPLPTPPRVLMAYLVALADGTLPWERVEGRPGPRRSVGTIRRKLCAISRQHATTRGPDGSPLPNPTHDQEVKDAWDGVRRRFGKPPARKRPVSAADLEQYVAAMDDRILHRRDAALLSLGFAAALRESELVGLDVEDVQITPRGLTVTITHSKTDQYGKGRTVPVPAAPGCASCPVATLRAWLAASLITEGPIFRPLYAGRNLGKKRLDAETVAVRVKEFARATGLDPKSFAGHSLRAGFVTSAYEGDADLSAIMDVTGHQSFDMVKRYIREVDMWKDPAGAKIKRR